MKRLDNLNQLVTLASGLSPKTIIIPGGERPADLEVYKTLMTYDFVKKIILIGDKTRITDSAKEVSISVPADSIVDTNSEQESAEKVVELVNAGEADLILKGNISSYILNRQILKLKINETISLCSLFQSPYIADGRPLVLTDPGVTTICNYTHLTGMIENGAQVARLAMGIDEPKIALLSANEKIISSLTSTEVAQSLSEAHWDKMSVFGPLSFDLATSLKAVSLKGIKKDSKTPKGKVMGEADVLVCPNLDAANILYKVLMGLVDSGNVQMACMTLGVKVPYILLSRADNEETKINSIALGCIYAENMQNHLKSLPATPDIEIKEDYKILSINPGSTSTKLGLFNGEESIADYEVVRNAKVGLRGDELAAEISDYLNEINGFLEKHDEFKLDAIVGRGGFIGREKKNIEGGTYVIADLVAGKLSVNQDLIDSVCLSPEMDHPSNYGIPIAAELAKKLNIPAYMVDAVVADDFTDVARISGYKGIERKSTAHFLSLKAMAGKAAALQGRPTNNAGFVCVHMGGGISIAAYRNGKIIDNNIALLGEGPFSPQRAGQLPLKEVIELCYSGKFSKEEMYREFGKKGGLLSYLGTESVIEVLEMIENGNEEAKLVLDAMIYQIAKSIGSMFIAVGRKVDAIVFAGGMVRSTYIMSELKKYIGHLAPIIIIKKTPELEAMAKGALKVLTGVEKAKVYSAFKHH